MLEQQHIHLAGGELIYQEGAMGDGLFVILSGSIRLLIGPEEAPVWAEDLVKGDFFGEDSVLQPVPRAHTAIALEDAEIIKIPRGTFLNMVNKSQEICLKMIRKLSARHRATAVFQSNEVERILGGIGSATDFLVSALTGHRFPILPGRDILVGRQDPNKKIAPDIDLTSEDPEARVSRQHATIYREGDQLLLKAIPGVANGTFVNGKKLHDDEVCVVGHGSRICFGSVTMLLERGASPSF